MSENQNREEVVNKPEQQVYDPKKMYQWDRETIFSLNGLEFSILYNTLKDWISSPLTPAGFVKIADSFSILQNRLVTMVNSGDIREMDPLKDDPTVTEANSEPEPVPESE